MSRTFIAGGFAALAVASAANATTYLGNGGTIVDNNPAGATSSIAVSDHFYIDDLTVTITGLTHTWIGDLVVTVTHVDTGDTFSLFNRVGKTNATTGFGDSSNLGGAYSFNDAFAGNLWTAAAAVGDAVVVPGGNYFASGALSSAQVPFLPGLLGDDGFGKWTLKIVDAAGGDVGVWAGWSLSFDKSPIPAPGAFAMLGLAGLVGGRRRRA